MEISGGTGFDDVFVYAPVPAVVELGDAILGFDGSLNFFAGPLDKNFSANFNFYNPSEPARTHQPSPFPHLKSSGPSRF